jgi:hypothetical protein
MLSPGPTHFYERKNCSFATSRHQKERRRSTATFSSIVIPRSLSTDGATGATECPSETTGASWTALGTGTISVVGGVDGFTGAEAPKKTDEQGMRRRPIAEPRMLINALSKSC